MSSHLKSLTVVLVVTVGLVHGQAQQPPAVKDAQADPLFDRPYVDVDEWRDTPVRHRYVHGGFTGTDAAIA